MSADEQDLVQLGFTPEQALHVADRGGWSPLNGAFAYASASSFTINTAESARANLTGRLRVGTKIKLLNTTRKYLYVTAVTATAVTVTGGADYAVANAAISDVWYSNADTAVDFPDWFSWEPTFAGFIGVGPALANSFHRFKMSGRLVQLMWAQAQAESNATSFSFTVPIAAATITNYNALNRILGVDNSAIVYDCWGQLTSSGTSVVLFNNGSATGWTAANNKASSGQLVYEV